MDKAVVEKVAADGGIAASSQDLDGVDRRGIAELCAMKRGQAAALVEVRLAAEDCLIDREDSDGVSANIERPTYPQVRRLG